MNVYNLLSDLYEVETNENEIILSKCLQTIKNVEYNGFISGVKGDKYFIYHLLDVNGKKRTMGNKWAVYNVSKNRYVLSGVKTKREAIQFLENI